MDQQKCRHERVVTYKYIESDPVRVCEDCGAKNPEPFKPISPFDMGRMLADVLGLGNVRGIMRLAVVVEGGSAPRVEVTRMMTEYEAGVYCALLREWDCEIAFGKCKETPISAQDAASVRADPLYEASHPARG